MRPGMNTQCVHPRCDIKQVYPLLPVTLTPRWSWGFGISYSPGEYIPSRTNFFLAVKGLSIWNRNTMRPSFGLGGSKICGIVVCSGRRNVTYFPGKVPYFSGFIDSREFRLGGFGAKTCGRKSGGGLFHMSSSMIGGGFVKFSLRIWMSDSLASYCVLEWKPKGMMARELDALRIRPSLRDIRSEWLIPVPSSAYNRQGKRSMVADLCHFVFSLFCGARRRAP